MCRIGMFVEEGRKEDRAQLSKLTLSDALRYSVVEEEEREKKMVCNRPVCELWAFFYSGFLVTYPLVLLFITQFSQAALSFTLSIYCMFNLFFVFVNLI